MADKARRKLKNDAEAAPPLPSFGDLLLGLAGVGETAEPRQPRPEPRGRPASKGRDVAWEQGRGEPATSQPAGSAEVGAMVARTAPAILDLLGDGAPRSRSVIVATLAGTHPKDDVIRSLMRLAVTGGVEKRGSTYALGAAPEPAVD